MAKTKENYFLKNKKIFIISGIIIVCIAIATVVAVNLINARKAEEKAQQESALLDKFKGIYLMTTGKYDDNQGECVWNQITSIVNESDILDAAKEYDANGVIPSDSAFAKKIYSSIDSIHQKCGVETKEAAKNIDKMTDVIDITLSGKGTSSSDTFKLKRGLANITITAPSGVGLELKSTKDDWTGCYESFGSGYPNAEVGTFTKKCTLDYAGEYYFDIHLSGYRLPTENWTINIRQE